jgi:hypothetical protein
MLFLKRFKFRVLLLILKIFRLTLCHATKFLRLCFIFLASSILITQPVLADCNWADITCLPSIKKYTKPLVEKAWGEAGEKFFPDAAVLMAIRNNNFKSLTITQKDILRPHFGDLVDKVSISYNAQMLDDWTIADISIHLTEGETLAQTFCYQIYVHDSYKPNDIKQLITLAHELFHSKQCENFGGLRGFGFNYFREYKRAGLNYANNILERQAYDFENEFAKQFH